MTGHRVPEPAGPVVRELLAGGAGHEGSWADLGPVARRWLDATILCRSSRRQGDWGLARTALLWAVAPAVGGVARDADLDPSWRRLLAKDLPWAFPRQSPALDRDLWSLAEAEWANLRWVEQRLRFSAGRDDSAGAGLGPEPSAKPVAEAIVLVFKEQEDLRPAAHGDSAPAYPDPNEKEVIRRARELLIAMVPEWLRDVDDPTPGRAEPPSATWGQHHWQDLGGGPGIRRRAAELAASSLPWQQPGHPRIGAGRAVVDAAARRSRLRGLADAGPVVHAAYESADEAVLDWIDANLAARPGQRPRTLRQPWTRAQLAGLIVAALEGIEVQRLVGRDEASLPDQRVVLAMLWSSTTVETSAGPS